MPKLKKCRFCNKLTDRLWRSTPPTCMRYDCRRQGDAERKTTKGEKYYPEYSSIKQKKRAATGELALFTKIYAERLGKCEITGRQIKFDVKNFAHILSKGAHEKFRLNPDNIIHVLPDIHHYYDNSDKETLLKHYPEAELIYQKKEQLKRLYYNAEE